MIGNNMWGKFLVIGFFGLMLQVPVEGNQKTPPEKCARTYKKIGCFHDRIDPDRPYPYELVNHRDPINHNFDGHTIKWEDWPQSMHALACKCANLTRARGYRYFGLQFYGECWSGPSFDFKRDGPSQKCVGIGYKKCDDDAETECVGKQFTNYIYDIKAGGTTKEIIPGGWSEWSEWNTCSKSCGGGTRARERTCTNPEPENGGPDCPGIGEESGLCNEEKCEPVCPVSKLEIGIITDASSSIRWVNFQKIKSFAANLTTHFKVGPDGVHFGMIYFSRKAHLEFAPNEPKYWDPKHLTEKIMNMTYKYGYTRTDRALYLADKTFFCSACARPNVPKVLIVITDGRSSTGSDPIPIAAKPLKDKGVRIISIGITSKIDEEELLEMAHDEDHKLVIADFNYLIDKLQNISKLSCEKGTVANVRSGR